MLVALVGAMLEENLALGYLASSLRSAGHRVEMLGFDGPGDIPALVDDIRNHKPGLVGMSVAFQHRVTEFRDLSRALREAGVEAAIVWGGHIPTARPGGILMRYPWVDVTVGHDAESTIVELADALERTPFSRPGSPTTPREAAFPLFARLMAIHGLSFRRPGGEPGSTPTREVPRDLDTLSPPARDRRPSRHAGIGFSPVLSSRGCWQSCTYCSIQTYHRGREGPRVRFRDPDAVADEMADLYHQDNVRIFCFHDENLFLPKPSGSLRRMGAIRAGLDRRGVGRVGLVAKVRPDQLSPELLEETGRMGLLRVYVGIENGSQPGLDHLGRDTTVERCRQALGLLREAGVFACFNVLLFEPDTRLEDVRDNIRFLRDFSAFPWNFCRTEIYPGSLLERKLRQEGRLRGGLEGLGYSIADPRAELLFRITAVAFGGRNFGPQSTANAGSSLGYLAAVLRHFHRGRTVDGLVSATEDLTRRFGEDTLNFLDEATQFVERGRLDGTTASDFTGDLAGRIADHDAVFWGEIESLRMAMERFGTAHAHQLEVSQSAGSGPLARAAAVLAVATMASQGCGDKAEVVDSVPPDTEVMVVDPLPPELPDIPYLDVDPAPDDVPLMDDPPVEDLDVVEDEEITMYDPPPPDVVETQDEDIQMADPPPPDVVETGDEDVHVMPWDELPPVDPLPGDIWGPENPGKPQSSLPLDRGWRVALEVEDDGDGLLLTARLMGEGQASLRWMASGGTLNADAHEARFTPDGTGQPMVMVTARWGSDRMDVARCFPEREVG